MKRKLKILLGAVVLLVSGAYFASCGAAANAVTKNCDTLEDYCDSGKDAKLCCTSTNCKWEWNGKTYDCGGTSCTAAINDLVADACGSSEARVDELKVMTMRKMAELEEMD